MRFVPPLGNERTKTSAPLLLSPATRFDACETHARHFASLALLPRDQPPRAGENESPLAGRLRPLDASVVEPMVHDEPLLPPARVTWNTLRLPSVPDVMFVAAELNAA